MGATSALGAKIKPRRYFVPSSGTFSVLSQQMSAAMFRRHKPSSQQAARRSRTAVDDTELAREVQASAVIGDKAEPLEAVSDESEEEESREDSEEDYDEEDDSEDDDDEDDEEEVRVEPACQRLCTWLRLLVQ